MNGLNFMVTIIDRRLTGKFLQRYEASGLTVTIRTAGQGTEKIAATDNHRTQHQ